MLRENRWHLRTPGYSTKDTSDVSLVSGHKSICEYNCWVPVILLSLNNGTKPLQNHLLVRDYLITYLGYSVTVILSNMQKMIDYKEKFINHLLQA